MYRVFAVKNMQVSDYLLPATLTNLVLFILLSRDKSIVFTAGGHACEYLYIYGVRPKFRIPTSNSVMQYAIKKVLIPYTTKGK